MKTVLEHMKAAGFAPATAWNEQSIAKWNRGTMECESIKLRTFRCRPDCMTDMIGVEATAIVPWSDGGMHPYPGGWPNSMEASVTAYFEEERSELRC